jgi:hypothetical protein
MNCYACCSPFVLGVSTFLVGNDRKGSHTSLAVGVKGVFVEIMFPLRQVLLVGYGGCCVGRSFPSVFQYA